MHKNLGVFCGRIILLTVFAAVVGGCGDDRPDTLPAGGTITYNGQPVAEARVMFLVEGGRPASGMTDSEGRFELTTFEPGDGALPGEHKVTVSKKETVADPNQPDNPYAPMRDLLPAPYGTPAKSELSAKVEAGSKNDFTFELHD